MPTGEVRGHCQALSSCQPTDRQPRQRHQLVSSRLLPHTSMNIFSSGLAQYANTNIFCKLAPEFQHDHLLQGWRNTIRQHKHLCKLAPECQHDHLLQGWRNTPTQTSLSRLAQYANTNISFKLAPYTNTNIFFKVGAIRQHDHLQDVIMHLVQGHLLSS